MMSIALLGLPAVAFAASPCICNRILTISSGFVKTCLISSPHSKRRERRKEEGKWTHDLATSCTSSSDELPGNRDASSLPVRRVPTHEVVDGELDRLFWCNSLRAKQVRIGAGRQRERTNDELRGETAVESEESLVPVNLLDTIWTRETSVFAARTKEEMELAYRVLVQQLSNDF